MTRDELNQSNQTNILGAGKVTKNRHWTHNENIAEYVDESIESLPEDADFISEVAQSSGIQTAIINANTATENANQAAANIPSTQTIVEEVLNTDTIKDIEAKTIITSSGLGDTTLDKKLMLFCGDSTTWQKTSTGGGFDYLTTTFRKAGQPLENIKGYVNFGSSGYALAGFVDGALGSIPTINETENLGIGQWDMYGHNVQIAISLSTALAYRATRSEDVIWSIGFGANDVLLYAANGNKTQDEITEYIYGYLVQAAEKIKKLYPEDLIVFRMMNPMVARPFLNQGFPSATAYPTFGQDLATDVALVNKWNYGIRNAYLKIKGQFAKTFVFDTWDKVYGFIDASVSAATLPFMTDIVHPSIQGYINEMDALMDIFVPNKEINKAQKNRALQSATLNGGNAWDYYPNFFEGNTSYRRLFVVTNATIGNNYIDLQISASNFSSAVLGRPLYLEIDNVGAQKFTTYTVNSTGTNTLRLTGVAPIMALQGGAKGKSYIYIDAEELKSTDGYVQSQIVALKPREAFYGRVTGSGNGYIDITLDQTSNRISTKHLYKSNTGILVVGGAISSNITDLNTWTLARSGATANRVIRMTKAGDWSTYTTGTLIALTYSDLVVPPTRYEGILSEYAFIQHAQNNAGRVVARIPMVDGVTLSILMTEGLAGQTTTVEIFATRSNNRTSLGTITINPNAMSGATTINISTSVVENQIYEAIITSNTTQATGLVVLKMTPN